MTNANVFQCLERDRSVCLLTGTANPHVCLIAPFAFNSARANRASTEKRIASFYLLFENETVGVLESLLTTNLGSSDRYWNMLSLRPQLRVWWPKAHLALKCLGVAPGVESPSWIIQLHFHWLSRIMERPTGEIEVKEFQEKLNTLSLSQLGIDAISAENAESSRKILSNNFVEIAMKKEDVTKMKAMVDFQWAMARISALSGAAEAPELLHDEDTDTPSQTYDESLRVTSWLDIVEPDIPSLKKHDERH